jgi:hypothetical protein
MRAVYGEQNLCLTEMMSHCLARLSGSGSGTNEIQIPWHMASYVLVNSTDIWKELAHTIFRTVPENCQ